MANQDGTLVLLKIAGQTLTGLVTQGLNMSADEIDITTKDSAGVKSWLPGEFGGTFSAEGKHSDTDSFSFEYLLGLMQARTAIAFIYGGQTPGDVTYAGTCFPTSLSSSDPKNAERTWSATFRVAGALLKGSVTTTAP